MCGRFSLDTPPDVLQMVFAVPKLPNDFKASYNIAPSQNILAIRQNAHLDREAVWLRFGLVPHWQKKEDISSQFINARYETVTEKPMFKTAFKSQRCLIPATGFYEWQTIDKRKFPYYFYQAAQAPLAFAGIWSHWQQNDEPAIESCAILTIEASENIANIHHRMPVMLTQAGFAAWLDTQVGDPIALSACIEKYRETNIVYHRVSTKVNSPRHNDQTCIQAVGEDSA